MKTPRVAPAADELNRERLERVSAKTGRDYAGWSSALRSAMISVWIFIGTGRYFDSSIVNVPWPCVIERRSVE